MEILGKLFGSEAKVKIIRLFLFNPEALYTIRDVSLRTNVKSNQAATITKTLVKVGLLRNKSIAKDVKINKKGKFKTRKIKKIAYFLDPKFPYASSLSDVMFGASIKADDRLTKKLTSAGKIKLIIAAGTFVRQNDARLDLLIVGDDIHEDKLAGIIKSIETDIGRDLAYSSLTTADFNYRLDLHDRLVRDVIDFEYIILVDKIGFEARK
jgi:predicted transcriptional regulator